MTPDPAEVDEPVNKAIKELVLAGNRYINGLRAPSKEQRYLLRDVLDAMEALADKGITRKDDPDLWADAEKLVRRSTP